MATDFISYFFFVSSLAFALDENINQGVVMSLFSAFPVFVAVAFFFFYREKLKLFEVILTSS